MINPPAPQEKKSAAKEATKAVVRTVTSSRNRDAVMLVLGIAIGYLGMVIGHVVR